MKKITLLIIAITCINISITSQTTLAIQDFTGGTPIWTYTTDPAPFDASCASGDVWNDVSSLNNINTLSGDFWGVQDLNCPCGTPDFGTLTFPMVTIPAGYTNTVLSFKYDIFEYDNGDDVKYEVFIGGVSQGEVILVDGASNFSTSGTVTVMIPDGSATVSLILSIDQNGGGDYAGFDDFQVVSEAPTVPVKLISFTAKTKNKVNILSWTTATEINNDRFEIERSRDGKNFNTISFEKGKGTTYDVEEYTFTDEAPLKGNNYYRLRQLDFDGKFEFSNIIIVKNEFNSVKIYPTNVFNIINIEIEDTESAKMTIVNSIGETFKATELTSTINSVDISELPSGIYYAKIESTSQLYVEKIVKF